MIFFFFSSRRRHTRFDCDWSSDVCSSDLDRQGGQAHHLHRDDGQRWSCLLEGAHHWRGWTMNEALRNRLLAAAAGLAVTAAGGYVATKEAGPSAAVTLARDRKSVV